MVKAVAEHVRNTSVYESSVIASVLTVQLHDCDVGIRSGLIGRSMELLGTSFTIADCIAIWDVEIAVDDIIIQAGIPGRVVACAQRGDGTLCCFASVFELDGAITDRTGKYRDTGVLALWESVSVLLPCAWREPAGGLIWVVRA